MFEISTTFKISKLDKRVWIVSCLSVDCKTVGFFSKSVQSFRVEEEQHESLPSLALHFQLLSGLFVRTWIYAKIRTVLQSSLPDALLPVLFQIVIHAPLPSRSYKTILASGSKGDYMETIMMYIPPLPSFWWCCCCCCCCCCWCVNWIFRM